MDKLSAGERDAVYRRCISTYGKDAQIDMMLEEMSELAKALLKYRRRKGHGLNLYQNIVDEMADVKIMLRQMEIIFGCGDDLVGRVDYKVRRQETRLNELGGWSHKDTKETSSTMDTRPTIF